MGRLETSVRQQGPVQEESLHGLARWIGGLLVSNWGSPAWFQPDLVANGQRRGYGRSFPRVWWDTPSGVVIHTPSNGTGPSQNPSIAVGFVKQGRDVCISQVQTLEQRSIWLRDGSTSVSPRSKVLLTLARASLDCGIQLSTPDGAQKVQDILDLHGGFTLEEHAEMQWEEWLDGQTVVPHLQRTYDRLPIGWTFGEVVTFLDGNVCARQLHRGG
jgi:hypothetical protein